MNKMPINQCSRENDLQTRVNALSVYSPNKPYVPWSKVEELDALAQRDALQLEGANVDPPAARQRDHSQLQRQNRDRLEARS
jgi:hypothetical protein